MKRHIKQADLSAYVDGEARRPAQIEQHLASCPHCARACAALEALSNRLRALEAPEVRSGFRTRILGHVREQAQPSRPGWPVWRPFGAGMVVAGAAALALITALWAAQPNTGFDQGAAQIAAVEPTGEDAFLASIETPYAEASDTAWMFASANAAPQEQEVESVDELLIALARVEYFDEATIPYSAETDINTAVISLDDTERVTFLRLLTQIAREDAAL